MDVELDASEAEELAEALLEAFPKGSDFKHLVKVGFNEDLETIVERADLSSVVLELIDWAATHSRLGLLIRHARRRKPSSAKLLAVERSHFPSFSTETLKALEGAVATALLPV